MPSDLSRHGGPHFRLLHPQVPASHPIMKGRFHVQELRPGLVIQCTDITHLYDATTEALIKPSIKVILKLEGSARVRLGGIWLDLDSGEGRSAVPKGVIAPLLTSTPFERRCTAKSHERMVVISIARHWLRGAPATIPALQEHLLVSPWQPSLRAIAITEQLLRPPPNLGTLYELYQEGWALELIAEAFAGLLGDIGTGHRLRPAEHQRVNRLRELLDRENTAGLTLESIGQLMCCNPNTLQRHFRLSFGQSISEYLRESRLHRAAQALERDGVTVAQASEIAGYSNQANFCTAFKKYFNVLPKHFRTTL